MAADAASEALVVLPLLPDDSARKEDFLWFCCAYLDLPDIVRLYQVNSVLRGMLHTRGLFYPVLRICSRVGFALPAGAVDSNTPLQSCDLISTRPQQPVPPTPPSNESVAGWFTRFRRNSFERRWSASSNCPVSVAGNTVAISRTPYNLGGRPPVQPATPLDLMRIFPPGATAAEPMEGLVWVEQCPWRVQRQWLWRVRGLQRLRVEVGGPNGIEPPSLARLLWNNRRSLHRIEILWREPLQNKRTACVAADVFTWWSSVFVEPETLDLQEGGNLPGDDRNFALSRRPLVGKRKAGEPMGRPTLKVRRGTTSTAVAAYLGPGESPNASGRNSSSSNNDDSSSSDAGETADAEESEKRRPLFRRLRARRYAKPNRVVPKSEKRTTPGLSVGFRPLPFESFAPTTFERPLKPSHRSQEGGSVGSGASSRSRSLPSRRKGTNNDVSPFSADHWRAKRREAAATAAATFSWKSAVSGDNKVSSWDCDEDQRSSDPRVINSRTPSPQRNTPLLPKIPRRRLFRWRRLTSLLSRPPPPPPADSDDETEAPVLNLKLEQFNVRSRRGVVASSTESPPEDEKLPLVKFPRARYVTIQLENQYSAFFFHQCRFPACRKILIEEIQPVYFPSDDSASNLLPGSLRKELRVLRTLQEQQGQARDLERHRLATKQQPILLQPQNSMAANSSNQSVQLTDEKLVVPAAILRSGLGVFPEVDLRNLIGRMQDNDLQIVERCLRRVRRLFAVAGTSKEEEHPVGMNVINRSDSVGHGGVTQPTITPTSSECGSVNDSTDTQHQQLGRGDACSTASIAGGNVTTRSSLSRQSSATALAVASIGEEESALLRRAAKLLKQLDRVEPWEGRKLTRLLWAFANVGNAGSVDEALELALGGDLEQTRYLSWDLTRDSFAAIPMFDGNHLLCWRPVLASLSGAKEIHLLVGGKDQHLANVPKHIGREVRRLLAQALNHSSRTVEWISTLNPTQISQVLLDILQERKPAGPADQVQPQQQALQPKPPRFGRLLGVECCDSTLDVSTFALNVMLYLPLVDWHCKSVLVSALADFKDVRLQQPYRPGAPEVAALLERFLMRLVEQSVEKLTLRCLSGHFIETFHDTQRDLQRSAAKFCMKEIRCAAKSPAELKALEMFIDMDDESEVPSPLPSRELVEAVRRVHGGNLSLRATQAMIPPAAEFPKLLWLIVQGPRFHVVYEERLQRRQQQKSGQAQQNLPRCSRLRPETVAVSPSRASEHFARVALVIERCQLGGYWKTLNLKTKPRLRVMIDPSAPASLFAVMPKLHLAADNPSLIGLILHTRRASKQLRGLVGSVSDLVKALQAVRSGLDWRKPALKCMEVHVHNTMIRCLCSLSPLIDELRAQRALVEVRIRPRKLPPFLTIEELFSNESPEALLLSQMLGPLGFERDRLAELEVHSLYATPIFVFRRPWSFRRQFLRLPAHLSARRASAAEDDEVYYATKASDDMDDA